jgi:ribosomal protein S18 acetylase RimI-like enzyme
MQAILDLQYLAYQSEAELLNDFTIPPLKQTYNEIVQDYEQGLIFLKATDDNGDIIGSVRAKVADKTAFIGRVIVRPDMQGQGIGTKLLLTIEKESGVARYELFTSNRSVNNLRLYERLGYVRFKERKMTDNLTFVYLEKYKES